MPFKKGETPDGAQPFTSENQPAQRRSRKGCPNRATVYKRILKMRVDVKDPETGEKLRVTLYEAMALGQVQSAMKGNTNAWKEIQDSLHGKIPDRQEHTGADGGPIQHDITAALNKIYGDGASTSNDT